MTVLKRKGAVRIGALIAVAAAFGAYLFVPPPALLRADSTAFFGNTVCFTINDDLGPANPCDSTTAGGQFTMEADMERTNDCAHEFEDSLKVYIVDWDTIGQRWEFVVESHDGNCEATSQPGVRDSDTCGERIVFPSVIGDCLCNGTFSVIVCDDACP